MKNCLRYLLISILALSLSCTEKRGTETEDKIEKVQVKIDHGLYDESILDLEKILNKEPENQRARTILASVYVRRAGISVTDYFTLNDIFQNPPGVSDDLVNLKQMKSLVAADEKLSPWLKELEKINEVVKVGARISKQIERIPEVNEGQAEDIFLALSELEKLSQPTEGMFLYRGVIKILYFKYLWSQERLLPFGENKLCSSPLNFLANRLDLTKEFLVKMILDLAHGFPEQKSEFNRNAWSLDQNISQATGYLRTLGEGTKTVEAAIGMKEFKCEF